MFGLARVGGFCFTHRTSVVSLRRGVRENCISFEDNFLNEYSDVKNITYFWRAAAQAATTSNSLTNVDNALALITVRTIIGSLRPRIATSCSGKPSAPSPAVTRTSSERIASQARLLVMSCSRAATLT